MNPKFILWNRPSFIRINWSKEFNQSKPTRFSKLKIFQLNKFHRSLILFGVFTFITISHFVTRNSQNFLLCPCNAPPLLLIRLNWRLILGSVFPWKKEGDKNSWPQKNIQKFLSIEKRLWKFLLKNLPANQRKSWSVCKMIDKKVYSGRFYYP